MLFKKNYWLIVNGTILSCLLTGLSSCGNSVALEDLVGAAPELQASSGLQLSQPNQSTLNSSVANSSSDASSKSTTSKKQTGLRENNRNRGLSPNSDENVVAINETDKLESDSQLPPQNTEELLLNFPETFPVYPQAELLKVESDDAKQSGKMLWKILENRRTVADYYQAELVNDNWDIIKPFTFNSQNSLARAIAVKDTLRVELTLSSLVKKNKSEGRPQETEVAVVYHPLGQKLPQSSISQAAASTLQDTKPAKEFSDQKSQTKSPDSQNSIASTQNQANSQIANPRVTQLPQKPVKTRPVTTSDLSPSQSAAIVAGTNFTDLGQVPEQLIIPLEAVAALDILTPYTGKANTELAKFAPNEIITRGEYARWLISANNRYYIDNPGKKIYIAAKTSQPAFKDVPSKHPDFDAIQSLAEAGLIPSRLTEDSTNLLFRPDAPLTREDLLSWKVPLDMRQSLPKASIQAIEESWGFQDATDIDSVAIRALYADFQNGDHSNIRRILGYTTLFQPKKPVTRAEAGASLWYFGFQGEGITAGEVLAAESEESPS